MNIRAKLVLILGATSSAAFVFNLIYAAVNKSEYSYISSLTWFLSSIGLFLGIWFLVGFGFKEYRLSVTSTVVLFLSILVNSLVFAISDYGEMTMFWLLVFLIGSIGTKSTIHSVKSISDSIMNPLKNKIAVMEQRVDKDKMP
ncbi:MAG: hypothetical protein UU77_C0036G0012 [candidate division WWE3 bacterium GW2011_GWC1_41_7]|uniref:Uncharacterized protein n=3 Tax=Katanobacteria TaxID=422282 RepID=A0A0G0XBF9_UNCKA|nr:MAG: hypothetical protein UU77_C0036G0012 [candidate division WWE3 bacterium GW2011_GWC1_41_7]KKS21712.1 MAG: hypothetical protein UU80_C0022G0015 [candidate division WWE3 bacterium GW2011_GWA1_41_8]OGC57324.1 MAG: hypothetical protein A2976_03785 [candidate division WWE3 bacterium RIFCSPLOWO2_01_FULL_41_9]